MVAIPKLASDITADWLSAALREGGHDLPPIVSMEISRIGEGVGVLSEIYRLKLSYANGAAGPSSLVVKIPPPVQPIRDLAASYGFYEREVIFYRDLAPRVPMRSAACYAAAFDPATQDFVLLLEDICNARPGDQVSGLTLDQVKASVDALAAFHAAWWGRPELKDLEGVVQPFGVPPYSDFSARHGGAWASFHPFLKDKISPRMMRVGERMASELDRVIDEAMDGPRTLCHGDFRADNLMFETAGDGKVGLIVLDWQILMQGVGAFDLGYMMSGSVATDLRREHEMELLRGYHAKLLASGVQGYDFAQCLEDYRRSLLIGFTYCVQGGAPSDMSNPRMAALITAMAHRCEAAVEDHGLDEFLN
jgi:hypothetical protein